MIADLLNFDVRCNSQTCYNVTQPQDYDQAELPHYDRVVRTWSCCMMCCILIKVKKVGCKI